jgi:prepilin-type processing-associated H-X9-DG protein
LGNAPSPLTEGLTDYDLLVRVESGQVPVKPTFVGGFGSSHLGGGANFGFGDGSVRWLSQSIDQAVYRRLGHRCDGELIDDGAF